MPSHSKTGRLRTWERRANECKKKHRPKLRDWERDGFATTRAADFMRLKEIYTTPEVDRCIDRIKASELSVEDFIKSYEMKSIPCIISDIPTHENWKAARYWNFDSFRHIKDRYFKVGEDDDGYSVKMRFKYFLKYLRHTKDDSPLYIFDSRFENDSVGKSLLNDYSVPSYFPEDLFAMVGERRRPPYRWFLVGPERSGSTVHIDPLGTSAWNTVLQGLKLWVIFPPSTDKRIAKALDVIRKGEDDEAINYFVDLLPRLRERHPDLDMRIFTQYPGETVFVPGGWWHAVLNLEDSIAVTQNYCSHANFERVWIRTRKGRKKMAVKWRRLLGERHPDLARLADMWDAVEDKKEDDKKDRKHKKRKRSG